MMFLYFSKLCVFLAVSEVIVPLPSALVLQGFDAEYHVCG